jgi:hypothetical protein
MRICRAPVRTNNADRPVLFREPDARVEDAMVLYGTQNGLGVESVAGMQVLPSLEPL